MYVREVDDGERAQSQRMLGIDDGGDEVWTGWWLAGMYARRERSVDDVKECGP